MILLAIIFVIWMITAPFLADILLSAMQPGGPLEWWDTKILFPLRSRGSKLAKALGGCEQCFSVWLGTLGGTIIIVIYILMYHSPHWLWLLPTWASLCMGIAAMAFKIFADKFKRK